MTVKFGIIGCGSISRFHFKGLKKANASIVHIADVNEEAAKPYVEQFGARFSTNYREVIENPEVTVVSVLTSAKFHKEICLAALAAGKDVICEKTMSNNAEEAEEIARAAKASGQLFFTSYMKRFFPAAQKAKELLPQLGRLFSAQVRAYQCWDWANFYELESGESQQWIVDNYGGAAMKCAGSHMMDMTLHLLGRPDSLYAYVDYVPQSNVDRKATALFQYPDGFVVSFETALHQLRRIGYERNSWDEKIEIHGVNGKIELYTVMWDASENNGALFVYYDNATETSTEYRFPAMDPFDAEMAQFVKWLETREQGSPNAIDGMNVDILIATMAQSSEKQAAIPIVWPI